MPIYGLSDQTPTIKVIGKIHKGSPKEQYAPGRNLEYFRVVFRDDEQEAKSTFEDVYGDKPVFINVRLAFDTISENWFAWMTCYLKGGMLGMADGKKWHYLRDYRSQKVLIRNGELTKLGEERGMSLDFDPETPVYFYRSKRQNKDMPVYAKEEGRLSVMVPELGRFVSLTLLTSSKGDIAHISGFLRDLEARAKALNVPMSFVPLTLSRQKEQISKPIDNGRGMVDEWMVKLEIHPDFAGLAIPYLTRRTVEMMSGALPAPDANPALPEGDESNGEGDSVEDMDEDGEIKPGPQLEGHDDEPDHIEVTEPDDLDVADPVTGMTPKFAMAEVSSKKQKYGDLDTETLANMANSLLKSIKDNGLGEDELAEKQRKLNACRTIMAYRQTHPEEK